MSAAARWQYYRRIVSAYLIPGKSQLTFWHEVPEINPRASKSRLGEYYMLFRQKSDYSGHYDAAGIPMLDYHGAIGLQYNPIAIAQWGLGNYNLFCETAERIRWQKTLKAADWLAENLQQNAQGVWVWNHHFDWEYRETLRSPWYSGLAQGQGVSLLMRAYAHNGDEKYRRAAGKAFVALTLPIGEGGVLVEDENKNLWIEEYLVDPPTHILNGFMWALWGVFDFWLASGDAAARTIFDRGVETLVGNLERFDTGFWSLYELPAKAESKMASKSSGARSVDRDKAGPRMLASAFYHRLHVVQLRVMSMLTGDASFQALAQRWEDYARSRRNRTRALLEKSAFKLLHY